MDNRALIGRIERNDFLPSILQLNSLAEVLEFDLQDILEDDTPMVATAFRGSDLTEEEESALDHLFDMMTAVKQQVLLRKALHSAHTYEEAYKMVMEDTKQHCEDFESFSVERKSV